MEEIVKNNSLMSNTRSVKDLLGLRVLSKSGENIGIVKDVRYNFKNMSIEGILTKHPYKESLYIGKDYIHLVSEESVILSVDPATLTINKKVITHQGKILGKVKEIERVGNTNSINKMHVRRFLHKSLTIKPSDIEKNGDSIILKEGRYAQK